MCLDVYGCVGENEAYHLAVWPSLHVEGKNECAHHPAAPAEALEFVHLADEYAPLLLKNRVTFSHLSF